MSILNYIINIVSLCMARVRPITYDKTYIIYNWFGVHDMHGL